MAWTYHCSLVHELERYEDCSFDRFYEAPHIGTLLGSDVMLIRLPFVVGCFTTRSHDMAMRSIVIPNFARKWIVHSGIDSKTRIVMDRRLSWADFNL